MLPISATFTPDARFLLSAMLPSRPGFLFSGEKPGSAMMAPIYFREARMQAAHHIQGKIVRWLPGRVQVKITAVYRGNLRRGDILTLHVSVQSEEPIALGSRLYTSPDVVSQAGYVEAFLDGDPPDVVRDQIKFLTTRTRGPSGDPTQESFGW
jgi:hypothetical protein